MPFEYCINKANKAFLDKKFASALELYVKAKNNYKTNSFDYNIKACEAKLRTEKSPESFISIKKIKKNGISVVIPSYKGEATIGRCLKSLTQQSLQYELFEVVLVLNGVLDKSEKIVRNITDNYKNFNLVLATEEMPSAGNARNIGISLSSREYITFVDDDDYVSEDYLRDLYNMASTNCILVTHIKDDRYGIIADTAISKQLINFESSEKIKYNDISSVLTLNACKLVHANMLDGISYNINLKSGEDVAFWMAVIVRNSPALQIVPSKLNCIYYRIVRDNSVSRKMESYDFNVTQRLSVIKELEQNIELTNSAEIKEFVMSKVRAQLGFCISYLDKNVSKHASFIKDVNSLVLCRYIVKYVNSKLAKDLVISYCFPPYVDTAGVVAAKRIWSSAHPVDVISNQMDKIRSKEDSLFVIAEDYIGDSIVLKSPAAFSNWNSIKSFAQECILAIEKQEKKKGIYKSVYSRAMWPGSHFAAAFYKSKRPEIKWIAEFSDPLLFNIDGNCRVDIIDIESLRSLGICDHIKSKGFDTPNDPRLFFWCEYLPYVMADELIFTNENQLKYMLDSFPDRSFISKIAHKLKIIPQPTLSERFYSLVECDYTIDSNKINIAYFGAFYSKRGLDEIFQSLLSLSNAERSKFVFHIFTEQIDQIKMIDQYEVLKDFIKINNYLPYLKFLNLCTKMNYLFVNDSSTVGFKETNPYLPSKLSDYLGSGVPIWAACERESSMEKIMRKSSIGHTSFIGEQDSYLNALRRMLIS